jgi:Domain of unknown function (DUF4091)
VSGRTAAAILLGACALAAGLAPPAGARQAARGIALDASIGEYEDAALSVRAPSSGQLEASLDGSSASVLRDGLTVLRVEQTRVDGRMVADPLPPLAEVATVQGGEVARLVLRVRVPDGTAPGVYTGLLQIAVGATPLRTVPVTLRVWDVHQPALDDPHAFRTLFLVNPQTYEHAVTERTGANPNTVGAAITGRLYALLSQYRISPGSWGFGTPFPGGYENRRGWWRKSGSLMAAEGGNPYTTMRVPLDTQHVGASERTGVRATDPSTWGDFLRRAVLPFWQSHGWLDRAVVWGWDEPGSVAARRFVGPQACAVHRAAPGLRYLVTASPLATGAGEDRLLFDGRGCDDVDIWAVLSRRWYGTWSTGREVQAHADVEHSLARLVARAHARGAQIWSYTYEAGLRSPGYSATEPPTDARLFLVWNALAGADGTLYADGMTSYGPNDPYRRLAERGQHVLIYPARRAGDDPVSSLRLEALRDGIEDANLARAYVVRHGRRALARLVGRLGLLSIRNGRVLLSCTNGCDLRGPTKFAWPRYRTGGGTVRALSRLHRELLAGLAAPPS